MPSEWGKNVSTYPGNPSTACLCTPNTAPPCTSKWGNAIDNFLYKTPKWETVGKSHPFSAFNVQTRPFPHHFPSTHSSFPTAKPWESILLPHQPIFIIQTEIRAIPKGSLHKPSHLILIQIHLALIPVADFIVNIM